MKVSLFAKHHAKRCTEHYAHAREKHPYFCDRILPGKKYIRQFKKRVEETLQQARYLIEVGANLKELKWYHLHDCEIAEALDALVRGDKAQAVEECYDTIAILLRTVDVLEGRQNLGRPEKKGTAK